jgi:hypothetical protein
MSEFRKRMTNDQIQTYQKKKQKLQNFHKHGQWGPTVKTYHVGKKIVPVINELGAHGQIRTLSTT